MRSRFNPLAAMTALLLSCAGLWASTAMASTDSGCRQRWAINQGEYPGCNGTAMLSPANDSRTNLLMLLHDRHGAVGPTELDVRDRGWNPRRGDARPFDYYGFARALSDYGRRPADLAAEASREASHDDESGTRCNSNTGGTAAFIAALSATRSLRAEDAALLAAARQNLQPRCAAQERAAASIAAMLTGVRSAKGRAYATYLNGAAAFYDGDWIAARAAFTATSSADVPWVAEAARYMLGRVEINRASEGATGQYGDFDRNAADAGAVAAALRELNAYLQAYPQGRYAVSARGLLRKGNWLAGRRDALLSLYLWQFEQRDPAQRTGSLADLVQEMDGKLLPDLDIASVTDPTLLAVLDLKSMRIADDPDEQRFVGPLISRATLDGQRHHFAGHEALHAYVLAVHALYVADDPAAALRLIPVTGDPAANGYLGYSRRMLRALAMNELGTAGGRAALVAMVRADGKPFQRGTAELALAMHDERSNGLERVFASDSAIRDPEIREILLRYGAGPALLRQQAHNRAIPQRERTTAQFALLYKQLTRGAYADFVSDLGRLSPLTPAANDESTGQTDLAHVDIFAWAGSQDFACPALVAIAQQLAQNPNQARSRMCLGEFIRLNNLDPSYWGATTALDVAPDPDELGGAPTRFPGTRFSRLAAYRSIIADARTTDEDRAYALFRAVNCFAPSTFNGCDATEVPLTQRRAWFNLLKTRYPRSRWAMELRYYW